MSDNFFDTMDVADLVRIICYPTRSTIKYVNSLYRFLDEKDIGEYREFMYNGASVVLNVYTCDYKQVFNFLDTLVDNAVKYGLRCGMMVIPGDCNDGFWSRRITGFLPDDNDYYHG